MGEKAVNFSALSLSLSLTCSSFISTEAVAGDIQRFSRLATFRRNRMVDPVKRSSLSDDSLEFFKLYIPEINSQKMLIPVSFASCLDESLPNQATLRDDAGREFCVGLNKIEQCWYFTQNWNRFVTENELAYGDILVFTYNGFSHFDVQVFDRSGCEKSLVVTAKTNFIVVKDEPSEEYSPDLLTEESVPRRPLLTRIATENPHFVRSICQSGMYNLVLPSSLLTAYEIKLGDDITVWNKNGKKWDVMVFTRDSGAVVLRGGWRDFSVSNLLKHDKCLFEFIFGKDRKCRDMKVSVIGPDVQTRKEGRYVVLRT